MADQNEVEPNQSPDAPPDQSFRSPAEIVALVVEAHTTQSVKSIKSFIVLCTEERARSDRTGKKPQIC